MSKSRQDFVKGVVGRAEAETEMERDVVASGAELGLWDAEIRPTTEAGPPSAGSWTPTACTPEKKSQGRNPHSCLTCCLKGRRTRKTWLSVARRCFLPYTIFFSNTLNCRYCAQPNLLTSIESSSVPGSTGRSFSTWEGRLPCTGAEWDADAKNRRSRHPRRTFVSDKRPLATSQSFPISNSKFCSSLMVGARISTPPFWDPLTTKPPLHFLPTALRRPQVLRFVLGYTSLRGDQVGLEICSCHSSRSSGWVPPK
jgi:hypothetical protein